MKVIIAGSRDFRNKRYLEEKCDELADQIDTVISGCQKSKDKYGNVYGADQIGYEWADERGIPVREFPEEWDTLGNAAGPIRNQEMVENADALITFGTGKGTRDVTEKAKEKGLRIWQF